MSDTNLSDQENRFLMGGRSAKKDPVQIKIGAKTYSEANSLMQDIRSVFTEQDCQEVLNQLQISGALDAQEIAVAKQKASAFATTVVEPAVQRAAIIAVGMATQNGSLAAAKLASLAKVANALDRAGSHALADKIDEFLLQF